ncbi:MAG: DUF2115 domain-containing protein [Methanocorpusculum sp.]|uniref:DUF2115 domain-containing protein n=1 Tax=Methanocorpusculum sp. TaxID=2058474 RepID=UPI00271B418C|nr:DUF2115 domain-containing protein [Methanocorpusculum sp.]MDO9522687.1 DUF2115 domain-containing protein [Methanocorpusculum sp.]
MDIFSRSASSSRKFIDETVTALLSAESNQAAAEIIGRALSAYTVFDLQYIGGHLKCEVDRLPNPYRRMYKPFCMDLLDQYHEFMQDYRPGIVCSGPLSDLDLWKKYWVDVPEYCFQNVGPSENSLPTQNHPLSKFFYRLVFAYVMFVKGGCGHPVGMPFPGGLRIRQVGDIVYCPIRDREKDLPQALCNFCPAKQDPDY